MSTLKQRLGAQTRKPTGLLGWAGAGVMLVEGPSSCHHGTIAELLALRPDDEVLDVACGSALFLRRYAAHVRRVAGVDHSAVQVRLARRLLNERIAAGTAEILEGAATALPWSDGTFTAVTCNCLSCISDAQDSLAEMCRVLRSGGRLVVATDFYADEPAARRSEREWGWRTMTEVELRRALEQVGFARVRLSHDEHGMFATAVKPA